MSFAAVDPIIGSASLVTLATAAIDGSMTWNYALTAPSISARPQFGGSDWIKRAVQKSGLSASGSASGYVSAAIWTSLRQKIIAGVAIAMTWQDSETAGSEVMSGNFVISNLQKTGSAEGYIEFTCSVESSGDMTFVPNLVITPADGTALAAQVGVSATVATFAVTGGNGTIAYAVTGLGASALSLNTSTGVLNGTPAAAMQGVYNLVVTGTDDDGVVITARYVLTIAAA